MSSESSNGSPVTWKQVSKKSRNNSSNSDSDCNLSTMGPKVDSSRTKGKEKDQAEKSGDQLGQKEVRSLLEEIMKKQDSLVVEITQKQDSLRKSLEQRISNSEQRLEESMKSQFEELKTHVDIQVGCLTRKIEDLEKKVNELEERDYTLNREAFSTEVTVVVLNLDEERNEVLSETVKDLFHEGLGITDVEPVDMMRLPSKTGRPGLVKIELASKEDKIHVLRAKSCLKETRKYRRVFIRSSMSHAERVMHQNFQTILNEMPNGHNFRIAGNGKVIPKFRENEDEREATQDADLDRDNTWQRGRGRGRGNRGNIRGGFMQRNYQNRNYNR